MLKKIYWELLCGFREADAEFSGVGLFCVMFSGRQWDAFPEERKEQYRDDYKYIGFTPSLDAHLVAKNSRKWLGSNPPPPVAHLHNHVFLMVEEQHRDAGQRFIDLATRGGTMLPAVIRDQLALYPSDPLSAWLWLASHFSPVDAEFLNKQDGMPTMFLSAPFTESANAIEKCRLHADDPKLPSASRDNEMEAISMDERPAFSDREYPAWLVRLAAAVAALLGDETVLRSFQAKVREWAAGVVAELHTQKARDEHPLPLPLPKLRDLTILECYAVLAAIRDVAGKLGQINPYSGNDDPADLEAMNYERLLAFVAAIGDGDEDYLRGVFKTVKADLLRAGLVGKDGAPVIASPTEEHTTPQPPAPADDPKVTQGHPQSAAETLESVDVLDGDPIEELNDLDQRIPALDIGNSDWQSNKAARALFGQETRAWSRRRSRGKAHRTEDDSYGLHDAYLFWRKTGNDHPYYYLPLIQEHAGHLAGIFPESDLESLQNLSKSPSNLSEST